MQKLLKAYQFAEDAHKGQIRRYTNEPFFNHPVQVMNICSGITDDKNILCSALLHDVVEDVVNIRPIDIYKEFGIKIYNLVVGMTDLKHNGKSRAEKKKLNRERISKCSDDVKTIKLADIISNVPCIIENDKKFAKTYVNEKRLQLKVLTEGNEELYNRAKHIIDNYYKG